jgi:hypothetical protein
MVGASFGGQWGPNASQPTPGPNAFGFGQWTFQCNQLQGISNSSCNFFIGDPNSNGDLTTGIASNQSFGLHATFANASAFLLLPFAPTVSNDSLLLSMVV